jgi:hypothetical protein
MIETKQLKTAPFYKTKFFLILALTSSIAIVLALLLQIVTPPQSINQSNTWNTITPGKTKMDQVIQSLGQPKNRVTEGDKTILQYTSIYPAVPHQVAIDKQGVVSFIKELVPYDELHVLSHYINEYGEYDLSLFAPNISRSVKGYVFLQEGVIVFAHVQNNTVQQKWYFSPTDKDGFMLLWGESLKEEDVPETMQLE